MLQQESLVHIYLFFHPWKFTFTKPTPNFRAHSTPYCESHIGNRTGGTNSFMSAWQASCSQNHCHKFKVNNIITIHKFPLLPGFKDTPQVWWVTSGSGSSNFNRFQQTLNLSQPRFYVGKEEREMTYFMLVTWNV